MFEFKIGSHLVSIPLESFKLSIIKKDNKELYQNIYVNLTDDNIEDNDDSNPKFCFEGIYLYKEGESFKYIYGVNSHKLQEILKQIPLMRKRFNINTEINTMCDRYSQDIDTIIPKLPITDDSFKNIDISIKSKFDLLLEENTPSLSSSQSSTSSQDSNSNDIFKNNGKRVKKYHYAPRIIPISILPILFQDIKIEEKSTVFSLFHTGSFHRLYDKFQEKCLECCNTDEKFLPQFNLMKYNVLKLVQIIEYRCYALQRDHDKHMKRCILKDLKKRKLKNDEEKPVKKRKLDDEDKNDEEKSIKKRKIKDDKRK